MARETYIQMFDKRINAYINLTPAEANGVNVCREFMLQAETYAREGKNIDSFYALARVERDRFAEDTNAWNLCENAIAESSAKRFMRDLKSGRVKIN